MYTVDVSQDPALYQIPQTDRSVSTDICRKIKMLTSLCIWLDSFVIMTMNIQAPGKTIDRLMGEKDLLRYKQRSFINLIKDVLIVFSVIMIAKQKNFMPCLDLCGKFRAAHIAEADEGITSCHLVIDDPDLFLWGNPVRIHQKTIVVIQMQVGEKINRSLC